VDNLLLIEELGDESDRILDAEEMACILEVEKLVCILEAEESDCMPEVNGLECILEGEELDCTLEVETATRGLLISLVFLTVLGLETSTASLLVFVAAAVVGVVEEGEKERESITPGLGASWRSSREKTDEEVLTCLSLLPFCSGKRPAIVEDTHCNVTETNNPLWITVQSLNTHGR